MMGRDGGKNAFDQDGSKSNHSFFDSDNYIIQLGCNSEEFYKALDNFNKGRVITPVLRSFLHEHAHFLQCATTSLGYYLKMLKDFQLMHLTQITNEMLHSPEFTYPMMRHIAAGSSNNEGYQKPIHYYYYWVLAEIVRLMLIGDSVTLSYYLDRMMQGYGFSDYFLELEPCLGKLLCGGYQNSERILGDGELERKKILNGSFFGSFADSKICTAMESQALLSEYFFDETAEDAFVKALEKATFNKEQAQYLMPLVLYRSAYSFDLKDKNDFLSFKLGFNAICQITFNAPILPFQDKMGPYSLGETELDARFNELLLHCGSVPPPKSQADYGRYLNELIAERSYLPLERSYQTIVENKGLIFKNPLTKLFDEKEKLFLSAQREYAKDAINYYEFLSGQITRPRILSMKFSDTKLNLSADRMGCFAQDLVYQYYTELLYGYDSKETSDQITVCPIVELSEPTMSFMRFYVRTFNQGLKMGSKLLPEMKLAE